MALVVFQLGFIYFLGHLFAFVFSRYKIPDVLLFMLLGITLGPLSGLTSPADFGASGAVLSTLALLIILFQSGVTLNLKSLATVSGVGTLLTVITFIVTMTLIFFISLPFTESWQISLLTGIILSGTSSAVVIPMTQALKLSDRSQNILLLESSVTDVLCIILTLALTRAFTGDGIDAGKIGLEILLSFGVAILLGLLVGVIWSHYKQKMRSLATIAMAMLVYGLVELIGFSGPIAVMSMGFAIANSVKFAKNFSCMGLTDSETEFYTELSFILKTFFFIFLGISMRFDSPLIMVAAAVITLAIIFIRKVFVELALKNSTDTSERNYITLLIPKGLAAAVLAEIPMQQGLVGAEIIPQFVYATVLLSIVIVSIWVPFVGRRKATAGATDNKPLDPNPLPPSDSGEPK